MQITKENRKNGGTRGQSTRGLNPISRLRDANCNTFFLFYNATVVSLKHANLITSFTKIYAVELTQNDKNGADNCVLHLKALWVLEKLCCSMYQLCCSVYNCVVLGRIVLSYVLFVSIVLFYLLFVCKCVLYYCHRVATQLQLNISYHKTRTSRRLRSYDTDAGFRLINNGFVI
jgi:hypothetical protein